MMPNVLAGMLLGGLIGYGIGRIVEARYWRRLFQRKSGDPAEDRRSSLRLLRRRVE